MKWKIYIVAFVSIALAAVPDNIIGCGPSIDPYDYYTSFFNQYNAGKLQYQPFYYIGEQFLFDVDEPKRPGDVLVKEWSDFTGGSVSETAAHDFVMQFAAKDISNLYYHIEKNATLKIPDSVMNNGMTKYFLTNKNLEALGYILYAKNVEPYVTGNYNAWDVVQKDSIKMNKLCKNGWQLYHAAKTDLFKLKYAYQIVRLSHYNADYTNAIKYYDELIKPNTTQSILQPMSLALKAGALFRLGRHKEAAYLFAEAFDKSEVQKISNYYGFNWAVVKAADKKEYWQLCRNDAEKANMLALFALSNPATDVAALEEIYALQPSQKVFSTLVVREINKCEERFLSPLLQKNNAKDKPNFYYTYHDKDMDSVMQAHKAKLQSLQQLLITVAKEGHQDKGLMLTGAGYLAYMLQQYPQANAYLDEAQKLSLTTRLKDQLMLTRALITISEATAIDAAFEQKLLPVLQWLRKKAKSVEWGYDTDETSQWSRFYRNLLVEILANRYRRQGDLNKELLMISAADNLQTSSYTRIALEFLRSRFNGLQSEKLYTFLKAKNFTAYENFLVQNGTIAISDVADFAGTAYLRDYNYNKAIEWLSKEKNQNTIIKKNPFIDLLYDREERLPGDKTTTTKLAYAKEMKRLQAAALADNSHAAKYWYKLALGCYNVTYYGYAWNLVEYYRSGVNGYNIPANATPFQKEYYGAFTAEDYFKKAMEATTDKELKARCVFMMAKCAQKQVQAPTYWDYYNKWDAYDAATKVYQKKFEHNKYFPKLKASYSNTRFYEEAITRCSYLMDFVE